VGGGSIHLPLSCSSRTAARNNWYSNAACAHVRLLQPSDYGFTDAEMHSPLDRLLADTWLRA
jgi:hypothetical protein